MSGGNDNGDKSEMWWLIGQTFIPQYFNTLTEDPAKCCLAFYADHSAVARIPQGGASSESNNAVGKADIGTVLQEFKNAKIKILSTDCQNCINNSALVVVTGIIIFADQQPPVPRSFTQTFILDQDAAAGSWYVRNDLLRFTDTIKTSSASSKETTEAKIGKNKGSRGKSKRSNKRGESKSNSSPPSSSSSSSSSSSTDASSTDAAPDASTNASSSDSANKNNSKNKKKGSAKDNKGGKKPKRNNNNNNNNNKKQASTEQKHNNNNNNNNKKPIQPTPKPQAPAKPMSWAARLANNNPTPPQAPAPTEQPSQKKSNNNNNGNNNNNTNNRSQQNGNTNTNNSGNSRGERKAGGRGANSNSNNVDALSLYVNNLPEGIQEEQLKVYFGQFGEVTKVQPIGHSGKTCFIFYRNAESVDQVLSSSHMLEGDELTISRRKERNHGFQQQGRRNNRNRNRNRDNRDGNKENGTAGGRSGGGGGGNRRSGRGGKRNNNRNNNNNGASASSTQA